MSDLARQNVILGAITLYMVSCVLIGVWALRRTKSTGDFFMAGRRLGVMVTGFAVFSCTMSGFGFIGGPGLVYKMGMSSVWIVVSATMGYAVSFFLLAKRLRFMGEFFDSVSLPDAIARRYSSETCRLLSAIAILLGVIGYLATQVKAMALVLRDLVSAHPSMPDISLEAAMAGSCAVLVFYCVAGGILAGVYSDMVQGAVMVVASVLVFFTAVGAVDGGLGGIGAAVQADDTEALSPWGTLGMLGCLSWYFLFALGGAGQPHVITKNMMVADPRDARHILPLSMAAYSVAALLWIGIGLTMRALVLQGEHPPLASADDAAPQFLQHYAPALLAGVVFAGLFAAIMSTADSFLNIGAAAWVHDIPKALLGRSLKHELLWARIATTLLVAIAAGFALYTDDLVALLGAFGWGTFAAALVPTVAIGFNWKRATAPAACTAIAASLAVNFGIKLSGWAPPHGVSEGAIALLVSVTLFLGISLASRPPRLDPDVEKLLDL